MQFITDRKDKIATYAWLCQRIKAMSLGEYFYRLENLCKERLINETWFKGDLFKKINENEGITGSGFLKKNNLKTLIKINDEDSMNRYSIFDFTFQTEKIKWNYDYKNKIEYPQLYFSKINLASYHKQEIKYALELSKFQYLTKTALCYAITKETKYLNKIIDDIESWIQQVRFLYGIDWKTSVTIPVRLLSWIIIWQLIDFDQLQGKYISFRNKWLRSIEEQLIFLSYFNSKYSSANNHLIAELTGLYIGLMFFKEIIAKDKLLKNTKQKLEEEIRNQNYKAGINKEQAFGYMYQVTDYFFLSYLVSINLNDPFSSEYKAILMNLIEYISNSLDCGNNYLNYGDGDDCHLIDVNFKKGNSFVTLCNSAAIFFEEPKWVKSNDLDERCTILFGEKAKFLTTNQIYKKNVSKAYKEEGHIILRTCDEQDKEVFFHFKASKLGHLSIAAHGHADALSFYLSYNGIPIFIDPGTYCYKQETHFRNYFKGTLAHNTIRIDGQNQSKDYGSNHWTNHAEALITDYFEDNEKHYIKAFHQGYKKRGVVHQREILFFKHKFCIYIIDEIQITDSSEHLMEQTFHLANEVITKSIDEKRIELMAGNKLFCISTDNPEPFQIRSGESQPEIIGWQSTQFLVKYPIKTIYLRNAITRTAKIKTIIS